MRNLSLSMASTHNKKSKNSFRKRIYDINVPIKNRILIIIIYIEIFFYVQEREKLVIRLNENFTKEPKIFIKSIVKYSYITSTLEVQYYSRRKVNSKVSEKFPLLLKFLVQTIIGPQAMLADGKGNIYVGDSTFIRKIDHLGKLN